MNATSTRAIQDQCAASRSEGTCQWVLKCQPYLDWMNPESKHQTLWIHAPPGFGTSVISAALWDHLETDFPNDVVGYFCSATQDSLGMPSNILRSCLSQAVLHRLEVYSVANESMLRSESQIATESEL